MLDPMYAFDIEELKRKTSTLPSRPTTSLAPIPTVIPNVPTYQTVSGSGTRTLWVVFAIMLLSTLAFAAMAFRVPVQKRIFHVLTTFVTLFATLSYFAMATGNGNNFVHFIVKESHNHVPSTVEHFYRQVFWARYVDWSLTTPLLLLELSFLAGLSGANIIVAIVADVFMGLTGLFAAYGHHNGQKWGYYAMACLAYLVIVYQLTMPGRRAATAKDARTSKLFAAIGGFLLIVWIFYPVVWGIGAGTRKWSVDGEIIVYAVLDILAKPVFGFWLLFANRNNTSTSLDGWWSHGLSSEGSIRIDDDEGA